MTKRTMSSDASRVRSPVTIRMPPTNSTVAPITAHTEDCGTPRLARLAANALRARSFCRPLLTKIAPSAMRPSSTITSCLDPEIALLDIVACRELDRAAAPDYPAFLQHIVYFRDAGQRLHVLVDDENRQPFGLQPLDRAVDFRPHQRREPLGRLVEDQQPRIGHQSPADGEHLLLTARQLVAVIVLAFPQLTEEFINPFQRPRVLPAAAIGRGGEEVFTHRQIGKHLAAFWDQADSCLGNAVRGQPPERPIFQHNLSALRLDDSHDRAHGRGLAHSVASEQGDHLLGFNFEVHSKKHLAAPIRRLQIAHFEHQSPSPRYAFRTSALIFIFSGESLAMTRPYTSTEMRSARRNTASMSCSTRTMVWRRLSEDSSAIMCCDSSTPMPAIGSSRSSSRGRVASAIATSSWRCSPCARLPARTFIRSLRPTSSSTWRAGPVSAGSLRASRQKRKLCPERACTASATFSSAVKPG